MKEIFGLKQGVNEAKMEQLLAVLGLQLTLKGHLKTLPENLHWHYKKPKHTGTLEITLILQTNELIVECKKSRWGDWVEDVLVELSKQVKA